MMDKINPDDWTAVDPKLLADKINPSHYKGAGGLEVIDVIEAFGLQHDYYLATAIKYILRAGKKSGAPYAEDVDKAVWFLHRAKWFRTVFMQKSALWTAGRPRPENPQTEHLADGIESGRE